MRLRSSPKQNVPASEHVPQILDTKLPPPPFPHVSISDVSFTSNRFFSNCVSAKFLLALQVELAHPPSVPVEEWSAQCDRHCHSTRNPGMTGAQEPLGCGSLGLSARPTTPPSPCPSSGTLVSLFQGTFPPGQNSNNLTRCKYNSYFCLFSTQIAGKWHHQMQLGLMSFQGFKYVVMSCTVSPFLGPSGHMIISNC